MLTGSDTALFTKLIDRASTTSDTTPVQLPCMEGTLTATQGALGCRSHGVTNVDLPLDDMRIVLLTWVGDSGSSQASRRNSKNL